VSEHGARPRKAATPRRSAGKRDSAKPYVLARRLAARFEELGFQPFASEHDRYAVILHRDRQGEIIELGRPLKGYQFFPTKALRRNIELLRQFKSFARRQDTKNWRFWSFGTTDRKARIYELAEDLQLFNKRINTVFSDCRKRHDFEVFLIVVHVRYDEVTNSFDLHAHFICQMPAGQREAVARRLTCAFSKCHLPDEPIRKLAAVVTYSLWGIYKARNLVERPATALSAVWKLSEKRPRLVRTGGSFAKWRRKKKPKRSQHERAAARRRRENRAATRYSGPRKPQGNRVLAKTTIRLGRNRVSALIVEEYRRRHGSQPQDSPSTTCAVTQDWPNRSEHHAHSSNGVGGPTQETSTSPASVAHFWWTAKSLLISATQVRTGSLPQPKARQPISEAQKAALWWTAIHAESRRASRTAAVPHCRT